jgi:hypothetical protein
MPIEIGTQIYFVDSNFIPKDSMFTPATMEIVPSGVLNADGRVVASGIRITDVLFQGARLENLKGVKHIFFRGYLNTTDGATRLVKFYSDYYSSFKVGVQVQAHGNFDPFNM